MKLLSDRQRVLFDHWRSLIQPGQSIPTRDRFDPVAVPQVLSMLMLLDFAPPSWRFRVVGTEVVDAAGSDYTSRLLSDVVHGQYHDFIHGLYQNCQAKAVPIVSHSRFQWDLGRELETVRLMLPLGYRDAPDTVGHILNAQVFLYEKTGPLDPIVHEIMGAKFSEHTDRLIEITE